jgi:hypothetical protein
MPLPMLFTLEDRCLKVAVLEMNALYLIWAMCCWSVWKERNNHIFKAKDQLVEAIKMVFWWWLKARKNDFSYNCHQWLLNPLVCLGI